MRNFLSIALLFICSNLIAQDAIQYQTPPKEIYDLVIDWNTTEVFKTSVVLYIFFVTNICTLIRQKWRRSVQQYIIGEL